MINTELLSFKNVFTIGLIIVLVHFAVRFIAPKLDME